MPAGLGFELRIRIEFTPMAVNFSVYIFKNYMKSLAITLIYFLAQLESRYQCIPANTSIIKPFSHCPPNGNFSH